jgi:PLP dependent protein
VAELRHGLRAARIAANLALLREEIDAAAAAAGRTAEGRVRILAASKYVPCEELPALAEAGIELVGENRAQDLERKVAAHGELFEWHFIGALQSRKVRAIVPHVSLIHSVASRSALSELGRHAAAARPGLRILIEVNLAGEEGKAGIAPAELGAYIEEAPLPVAGLMTMPPLCDDPEDSRRWFAGLRRLAAEHGLHELSMGTSQDFGVAVQEGATIVRIGTRLYD